MADTRPRQPRHVELLPPEKPTTQPPAAQTGNRLPTSTGGYWMPAPLVQRVLDKIARKDAQALGDLVAERNRVIALLTEQARLSQTFAKEVGRAATLPMMAAAAEIQAYAEQEEIIANVNHDQRMAQIRRAKELDQAERELAEMKRGPLPALPAPAPPPKESSSERRVRRIKEVNDECEQTIAALRKGIKEEDLDADTLDLISQCRFHAKRRIQDILQED